MCFFARVLGEGGLPGVCGGGVLGVENTDLTQQAELIAPAPVLDCLAVFNAE